MKSEVDNTINLPSDNRLGQGTAIEQSRAIAQVQAAVLVARQYPRVQQAAVRGMQETCAQHALAVRAFYEYRRAGQAVTGSTIYLARELARIWGNIDYGVGELRRDDQYGQSEMQAWAWDLETNTRVSSVFIVPHSRDVDGATKALKQNRDIYENNANSGARRLRECVRSVLPKWFIEDAEDRCRATIENPRDDNNEVIPLPKRIASVISTYEDLGVDLGRLEMKVGRDSNAWTSFDVAQLIVTGQSIRRNETSVEEAFPQQRVTSAEITGQPAAKPAEQQLPAEQSLPSEEPPTDLVDASKHGRLNGVPPITKAQLTKLHATLGELRVKPDEKHSIVGTLIGRQIGSTNELSKDEASRLIDRLDDCTQDDEPLKAFDAVLAAADQNGDQS